VVSGENHADFESASVHAVIDDDWFGGDVEATYDLGASTQVWGSATATVGTCTLSLAVNGPVCRGDVEPCDTTDAGWTLQCQAGVVRAHDRTTYSYCAPGAAAPACSVGSAGDSIVLTCPAACADEALHDFATTAAFLAFDPASACAP
jgi:hypothetical protein